MTLQFISTGCSKLDELLGGGIPIGRLTLIYGEAGSGKTTIALQVSVSAARIGLKVLYVDCDHSLRIERFRAIIQENFDDLSKRIIVSRPESFIEQSLIIGSLPRIISRDIGLVVVDSITNLYREAISLEEPFTVNWEFNRQIAFLKESAITRNVAVLAISQVRSVLETGGIEPVSRRIMLYWPDIVIALSKTDRPRVILCEIKKGGILGKFYAHISDQGLVSI